ncbi:MAG TPA: hypothetical protein VIK11_01645 [Tepidiformaceae bacterium]
MKRILWNIAMVAAIGVGAACGGGGANATPVPTIASPVLATPTPTPVPVFTDPPSFASSFLQCSPGELQMPFGGTNTYVVTVFGMEAGNCHYASKVVDPKGGVVQSGGDCRVPQALVNGDLLGHFFGQDAGPGKEATLAQQTKIETDYCQK